MKLNHQIVVSSLSFRKSWYVAIMELSSFVAKALMVGVQIPTQIQESFDF